MGDIHLELIIANWHDWDRQQTVSFLVDTGAIYAWIPETLAQRLGIEPIGTRTFAMADGSPKDYPYGPCLMDFGGERTVVNVVIGPPDCEPIVGTHVLQDFRLVIDLNTHTISRSRALRAK